MKGIFQRNLFGLGLLLLLLTCWAGQVFAFGGNDMFYPRGLNYNPEPSFWDNRIVQHVIAGILGAILGAFFSQKFKKYRRWIFILLVVLGAIAGVIANAFIGNAIFFILGFVIAFKLLKDAIKSATSRKPKATTFGSAEWATLHHLQEHNLVGEEGYSLGLFEERGNRLPIHYKGDRHLLTVAPTRSGKGVSSIIPNLLTYRGSAIVVDPKGENAMITATRRGKGNKTIPGLGQTVHVIDPWGITGLPSSRFNPLGWLSANDVDVNENAMILADSIVTPRPGGQDPFWDEEAKALLMGILLWVALDKTEEGQRTLGRVRDLLSLDRQSFNDMLGCMIASPNHIVSGAASRTLTKEEKLQSGVIASLQSHTHFLDSPRMRESLSVSDFSFEDLKTSNMTIYLVLPADRLGTFGRWLRLMIQQALTINSRNIKITPEKPVLFLLDEMSALGRLSMVEQAYSLMAGFGVQLWGIVQDLSQLERIYGTGWQTFIGNSGVIQYFGSRDLKTAEYFSKLCGVTTIEKVSLAKSIARSFGFSSGGGNSSSSSNTTYTENATEDQVQRNLAFPDELMALRQNSQLVFVENSNPIKAEKNLWFANDNLKSLGVNIRSTTPPQPPRPEEPAPTKKIAQDPPPQKQPEPDEIEKAVAEDSKPAPPQEAVKEKNQQIEKFRKSPYSPHADSGYKLEKSNTYDLDLQFHVLDKDYEVKKNAKERKSQHTKR